MGWPAPRVSRLTVCGAMPAAAAAAGSLTPIPPTASHRRVRTRGSLLVSIPDVPAETPRSLLTPGDVSVFGTPRATSGKAQPFFGTPVAGRATPGPPPLVVEAPVGPISPKPAASPRTSQSWFVTPTTVEQWEDQGLPFRVLFVPATHVRGGSRKASSSRSGQSPFSFQVSRRDLNFAALFHQPGSTEVPRSEHLRASQLAPNWLVLSPRPVLSLCVTQRTHR